MPIEKFPVLDNVDETLRLWKRNLEYLFRNLNDDNIASASLTLGNNQVKASNIDFGVGVNQVSAEDILIEDSTGYFTATTVEGALKELYEKVDAIST